MTRLGPGVLLCWLAISGSASAQDRTALQDELRRIYEAGDYATHGFGPARWLDGGASYTTVEPSEAMDDARDIVRYATASGRREVLVSAERLVPDGADAALAIDDYAWSGDRRRLLVYTNSQRVWRRNTRGDYWVLDLASGRLRQLGSGAPEATLMFAKFSPDASHVAYVRANDLYVEEIDTGTVVALTDDGSETTINGTADWVYEEEFGVRDGFRWSPDGSQIAFWNFDATGIGQFALINNTDELYPTISNIPYPKAGTTNSAVRIGVVDTDEGTRRWMDVPGDPRDTYVARMDWADVDTLVLQHLNRLQNVNDVLLAEADTGAVRRAHRDESDAWVEVVNDLDWISQGDEFLWTSEADGWRHVYRVARSGGTRRLVTPFDGDVVTVLGPGPAETWLYFIASPENATQRYLYRAGLDGRDAPERLTPDDVPGTHSYNLSPDRRWAFHTYSRMEHPPVVDLVRLPDHRTIRVLADNAEVRAKAESVLRPPVEFFKVDIGEAVLDGWMIKPRDFDPDRRHPLLVFVYGEPAGQTVVDRWGGNNLFFHRALANEGFVVVSVDNRGTPAPRGAAWRKLVYGTVGDLSARDQAAAVRALARGHDFIDGSRVAVWGWSGGGSNTLNAMFRFPEVFKVGVAVAPVPDQRLYDTIYQERYMGLPTTNADGYRIGSPINFAEGLDGRLLIIHGTGDDNVHYQGTERLVNRLIELGKPFDLMVYPNRSHGISEGVGTTLHVHSLIARYLLEARW
ncbi:MAG: S9 family peptidase [Vicinamibacterales bacterium]|nr:S9 family peptidase [Vicinamibacterales bacterium]|tara:strand:+ start:1885 stop:4119 length:2235 start_codon:yes stop_codon:yes gene_type:complete